MPTTIEALQSSVDTEIELLYTHVANKDPYIAALSEAPGQDLSSAIESWNQAFTTIKDRLDAAINKLRTPSGL